MKRSRFSRLIARSSLVAGGALAFFAPFAFAATFEQPLVNAADAGKTQWAAELIAAGKDVNAPAKFGVTPLMRAAFGGHDDTVALLLKAGANANAADAGQETALHMAAREGHASTVRLLLDAGAAVDARDAEGWTPLMRAASLGHPQVASVLLQKGNANATIENQYGDSAVTLAAASGDAGVGRVIFSDQRLAALNANAALKEKAVAAAEKKNNEDALALLQRTVADVPPPPPSFSSPTSATVPPPPSAMAANVPPAPPPQGMMTGTNPPAPPIPGAQIPAPAMQPMAIPAVPPRPEPPRMIMPAQRQSNQTIMQAAATPAQSVFAGRPTAPVTALPKDFVPPVGQEANSPPPLAAPPLPRLAPEPAPREKERKGFFSGIFSKTAGLFGLDKKKELDARAVPAPAPQEKTPAPPTPPQPQVADLPASAPPSYADAPMITDLPSKNDARPTPIAGDNVFYLQFGAFAEQSEAISDWEKLRIKYPPLQEMYPKVVPVYLMTSDSVHFRLRAGAFASEKDASRLCKYFVDRNVECLVVESAAGSEEVKMLSTMAPVDEILRKKGDSAFPGADSPETQNKIIWKESKKKLQNSDETSPNAETVVLKAPEKAESGAFFAFSVPKPRDAEEKTPKLPSRALARSDVPTPATKPKELAANALPWTTTGPLPGALPERKTSTIDKQSTKPVTNRLFSLFSRKPSAPEKNALPSLLRREENIPAFVSAPSKAKDVAVASRIAPPPTPPQKEIPSALPVSFSANRAVISAAPTQAETATAGADAPRPRYVAGLSEAYYVPKTTTEEDALLDPIVPVGAGEETFVASIKGFKEKLDADRYWNATLKTAMGTQSVAAEVMEGKGRRTVLSISPLGAAAVRQLCDKAYKDGYSCSYENTSGD